MLKDAPVLLALAGQPIRDLHEIRCIGDLLQTGGKLFKVTNRVAGMDKCQRAVRPILKAQVHQREGLQRVENLLRERLAPLAIPVTLPYPSVRKETILSDSPKGHDRRTMAGVTQGERMAGRFL